MVTAKERHGLRHRIAEYAIGRGDNVMTIAVRILDSRYAYGRFMVLVEPVYGNGTRWVNFDKLEVRT